MLHKNTRAGIYLYPPSVCKRWYDESGKFIEKKEDNKTISIISIPP